MSDAILGVAELGYFNGTHAVPLAQLQDITPPSISVAKVKISNHDSPDQMHEYIPGWQDVTDGSATLIYTKAQAAAIHTIVRSREIKTWYVLYRLDNSTLEWNGFLGGDGHELPKEDAATLKVTLVVTDGDVTYTPGS